MSCSCSPSSSSGSSHRRSSGSDDVAKEAPIVRSSPRKLRLPPANEEAHHQPVFDLNSDEEFPPLARARSSSSSLASSPEGDDRSILTAGVEAAIR